eukprot:6996679-Pyramimonas_sp.AAC.1
MRGAGAPLGEGVRAANAKSSLRMSSLLQYLCASLTFQRSSPHRLAFSSSHAPRCTSAAFLVVPDEVV